jgi:DNA-directed RNA polymerase specialized sigma24 family protein
MGATEENRRAGAPAGPAGKGAPVGKGGPGGGPHRAPKGPYRAPGEAGPGAAPAGSADGSRPPGLDARVRSLLAAGRREAAFATAIGALGSEVFGFIIDVLGRERGADEVFAAASERLSRLLPALDQRWPLRTRAYAIACREIVRHRAGARRHGPGRPPEPADLADLTSNVKQLVGAITTEVRRTRRLDLRQEEIAGLREELSVDDRVLLILHVDKRLAWDEIALAIVEAQALRGDRARRREAARLRARFRLIAARLTERARLKGLL